jgi:hypothetical protein
MEVSGQVHQVAAKILGKEHTEWTGYMAKWVPEMSGWCGEEKNLLPFVGNQPQFYDPLAHSLPTNPAILTPSSFA